MKKEQITQLVEHWRRPIPACDLFRFSHVLVNSKTDATTSALYEDSLGPHTVARTSQGVGANIESGPSTQARPVADVLGWDKEYEAANPVPFPSGPDDINMHSDDQPGPDLRLEQVIDPNLINLTHTGQRISGEPIIPTVPMTKKKPAKGRGRPKQTKSKKAAMQPTGKKPSAMPEVECPEPTTTVQKPRPRPRPLNPHLM
jgi:hypothetical protein